MALDFGEAGNAALESDTVKQAILFRINSDPVIRIWAGVGDFPSLPDLVDDSEDAGTAPAVYLGLGQLLALPEVEALINGKAESLEFSLSGVGVDAHAVNLAMLEAGAVQFQRFNIGLRILGDDLQPITPAIWLWEGECGPVTAARTSNHMENPVHALGLTIGSTFVARRRARVMNFSNAHHQAQHPGDRILEFVGRYAQGTTRKWP